MALKLNQIVGGLDEFLNEYGKLLGRKASDTLAPLHVPGQTDTVPISIFSARTPALRPAVARHLRPGLVVVGATESASRPCHHRRGDGHRQDPDRHVHPPRPRPPEESGRRLPGPGLLPQPPDRQVGLGRSSRSSPAPGSRPSTAPNGSAATARPVDATDADRRLEGRHPVLRREAGRRPHARPGGRQGSPLAKVDGPEFAIIGQNQSKFDPDWRAIAADKELGWHVYRRITFRPEDRPPRGRPAMGDLLPPVRRRGPQRRRLPDQAQGVGA